MTWRRWRGSNHTLFLITQTSGGMRRNNFVVGSAQAKRVVGCFACLTMSLAAGMAGFGKPSKGQSNSSSPPNTLPDRLLGCEDLWSEPIQPSSCSQEKSQYPGSVLGAWPPNQQHDAWHWTTLSTKVPMVLNGALCMGGHWEIPAAIPNGCKKPHPIYPSAKRGHMALCVGHFRGSVRWGCSATELGNHGSLLLQPCILLLIHTEPASYLAEPSCPRNRVSEGPSSPGMTKRKAKTTEHPPLQQHQFLKDPTCLITNLFPPPSSWMCVPPPRTTQWQPDLTSLDSPQQQNQIKRHQISWGSADPNPPPRAARDGSGHLTSVTVPASRSLFALPVPL